MQAQQELFSAFKERIPEAYDGAIPSPSTPYPFYYLAETYEDKEPLKNGDAGHVTFIVHCWHNDWQQRGTMSAMMERVMSVAGSITETATFKWQFIRSETEQQLIADNTTSVPLMHGWSSLRFNYSRKG